VHYLACQPWPFPSSLMLGCMAEALSRDITVDPTEIETAAWVPKAEMADILDGRHPVFASPRQDAIARSILAAWASGELGPF
jgi:NAD+ diphosphatase